MENRNGSGILEDEADTYRQLQGKIGFPKIYWFGHDVSYDVLIFELLGPSLEDLFDYCEQSFSLKTILLIAEQALLRIECIHRHFLHRDIKPENFLLGRGKLGNIIYAVDFGLAQEFSDEEECKGYQGLAFEGTHRFASINCHNGLGKSLARVMIASGLTDLIGRAILERRLGVSRLRACVLCSRFTAMAGTQGNDT